MIALLVHWSFAIFLVGTFVLLAVLDRQDTRSRAARRRRYEARQITGYEVGARRPERSAHGRFR